MTNEEAVEILKGHKIYGSSEPEKKIMEYRQALDLAIQALETGEIYITGEDYNLYMEGYKAGKKDFEPKQGEWISVSERLPDASGHKIVCFVKPQRIDNIYIGLAYFDNGRWVGYLKEDIVAWQPLPEPYEKGGAV